MLLQFDIKVLKGKPKLDGRPTKLEQLLANLDSRIALVGSSERADVDGNIFGFAHLMMDTRVYRNPIVVGLLRAIQPLLNATHAVMAAFYGGHLLGHAFVTYAMVPRLGSSVFKLRLAIKSM